MQIKPKERKIKVVVNGWLPHKNHDGDLPGTYQHCS